MVNPGGAFAPWVYPAATELKNLGAETGEKRVSAQGAEPWISFLTSIRVGIIITLMNLKIIGGG